MRTGGRRARKKEKTGDDDGDEGEPRTHTQHVGLGIQLRMPIADSDEPEDKGASSVAGPDAVDTEPEEHPANLQVEALLADKQALEKQLDEAEEQIGILRNQNTALQNEIEDLQAIPAAPEGSLSEFQTAIDKWRDAFETQKDIAAKLQNENASLRAGVATVPTGGPQTLAQMFNRAVDTLSLLDGMLGEGPDCWPEKIKARDRNRQINEVHHFLARLRGFRDVIELHSGVSEEEQP
jgi:hypothetical protein